jgi:mRNA-degrading endonuclease RelE of RelBE toxin-antitoxin system
MKILLMERFQKDVRTLTDDQRVRCFEAILALPQLIGNPHQHTGFGVRKIHTSGIWEVRLGLGLRLVFAFKNNEAILVTVGNHEDVERFLASL